MAFWEAQLGALPDYTWTKELLNSTIHALPEMRGHMQALPDPDIDFLEAFPSLEQRWQALSENVRVCYARWALADGGDVVREGGLMGTYSPRSQQGMITISSSDDALQFGEQIGRMLDWYRARRPLEGAICWYVQAGAPGDVSAQLYARGFSPNWQPHWMWCTLRDLPAAEAGAASFEIRLIDDDPGWQVDDLPNYDAGEAALLAVLARERPRLVWHLAAFQGQQVVGRCVLNVTTGANGVGGLFGMGVVPAARKQGIGTALARAACDLARRLGCQPVVLNATEMGEPVYRRVGFQSMGYGFTWHLRGAMLDAAAPSPEQVAFLEAIGRGDVAQLEARSGSYFDATFALSLPSGMTPLDIAVRCQQPESAAWLVARGVPLDLVSAWDVGWKERISALLAEQPELVNARQGEWGLTPLHIAVQRNDLEFARALLRVPNDLTIKDTAFEATALGWAKYNQRLEMIDLIQQHRRQQRARQRNAAH
jgi:GNAT superfamily N-acetyltransferase